MSLIETADGVVARVFVKPNAKMFRIVIDEDKIVVFCTEQPIKSRVNRELVKELSKLFHTKVVLVSGSTSKQKRLRITGVSKKEVKQALRVK